MITQMEREAGQFPEVLRRQLNENQRILTELTDRINLTEPKIVLTIARGSSDHAATFAKYLFESLAGMVTTSAAPSILTLYKKKLPLKNCLVLGISQSGASPDIIEMFMSAREENAITVALVNQLDSPLAKIAEYVIPLYAGEEKAVAATKSYLAALSALIHLVSLLTRDQILFSAIQRLPQFLEQALEMDWSEAISFYKGRRNSFVIGRGYSFPIAQEAALKFKETAKIHAEAFSGAEVLHGPFALIEKNFPVLIFAQQDESFAGICEIAKRMKKIGAEILLASPEAKNKIHEISDTAFHQLPLPKSLHPVCDPLIMIQAFYIMMARLSIERGLCPDMPANLTKVTQTW